MNELPLDRFLNAIMFWAVRHVEDPDALIAEVNAPDPSREPTERDVEEELQGFAAMMSNVR